MRAEPASLRLDPLDEATADTPVAERLDDADDAQGHRAVVRAECKGGADHILLRGGHDHEWLVGWEPSDEVVDTVITALGVAHPPG